MERKFYILVPVYKVEKFIDACIHSVQAQTYGNFRLILVDDGTPDRSGEICDAYARHDSRITVIHKENGGQNSARNAAIDLMLQEAAEEDFAIFLDSDDAIKPNTLQILNDTIEKDHCDMVVYGFDNTKTALIITKEHEKVAQAIGKELGRGATYLYSQGSYSKTDGKVVLVAVYPRQVAELKELVIHIDPRAFIIVQEAHQVLGDGFSRYSKESL